MSVHKQGAFFQTAVPDVEGNVKLRDPQVGSFIPLRNHYGVPPNERETCVILPVGCGKSVIIGLAPFPTASPRTIRRELQRGAEPRRRPANARKGGPPVLRPPGYRPRLRKEPQSARAQPRVSPVRPRGERPRG